MSLNFYATAKRVDQIRTFKGVDVPPGQVGDMWFDTVAGVYKQCVSTAPLTWVAFGSGGGGASDHGALTGLGDDDHPQYLNNARGDARYADIIHGHADTAIEPEFFYTDGILTRIEYADATYKDFAYIGGLVSTINNGVILKTFNYTDGVLTSITETVL
jgi:hypothetical protein